jgi:hypothetical protein
MRRLSSFAATRTAHRPANPARGVGNWSVGGSFNVKGVMSCSLFSLGVVSCRRVFGGEAGQRQGGDHPIAGLSAVAALCYRALF